jgi:hypothetical protein
LADKSSQLVLCALSRAVADPGGVPLHGNKARPGLFATNTLGRQAAQRCKDDGLLRVIQTEGHGVGTREFCAITEKGLAYLLSQLSPKQVLEDFIRALDARQAQASELLGLARQMQNSLDALKSTAEKVLQQVPQQPLPMANGLSPQPASLPGADDWRTVALAHLARRQTGGASEDCPLPELFRQVQTSDSRLTIGRFHDGLRRLHDEARIYLHPWTGPLYALPEPPYALLVGHEIAYYVSLRNSGQWPLASGQEPEKK